MNKPVILCVDDEHFILDSLKRMLRREFGKSYQVELAENGSGALEVIHKCLAENNEVVLVISDYMMPRMKGDELLQKIHEICPKTIKIMLTGQADIEGIRKVVNYANLYRYLTKPWQIEDLRLTIREALNSYSQEQMLIETNIQLQKANSDLENLNQEQAHLIESLKQAEDKYRRIFESALEGVFQATPDGKYISANPALARIYGYDSPEDLINGIVNIEEQLYVDREQRQNFLELMDSNHEVSGFESEVYRKDGTVIWISENARSVYDKEGNFLYYQGFIEEITERKSAEAERQQFIEDMFEVNTNLEIALSDLENALNLEVELKNAYGRFVPQEFIQLLHKESILDVDIGNHVQQEMSIVFSDIRDFTSLSEAMSPEDNFKFINAYLSRMETPIVENNGFIDKYIGDAIMAIFHGSADNALQAAIAMLNELNSYNETRGRPGRPKLKIGIGINTGLMMIGTVGGKNRMDSTVISDAVNLASRLEGLTKNYQVPLLISEHTFLRLQHDSNYQIRIIDKVRVKGKSERVSVFEVFNADPVSTRRAKMQTKTVFEQGLTYYYLQQFHQAAEYFEECLRLCPEDKVAEIYFNQVIEYLYGKE
ncbi:MULTISPECIES: adenylate/guanylate cyclase domain-containing protein [unclassified Roseofilum]|uniref:adenylate/guanylate cyclase domain-containing protein n=2 Tax=Roseofilum TaxID=1233426 RepID=UPI000E7F3C41|nr:MULTISPECIES: adenylate/guanylate cyclase domain-containing protein [unclassified Roseofilum]HBQ99900.1 guanylate cyclase [Cyanobacteria bacterium UBA11691]MBP0007049.1 PAS domain S-box protein [Roseofilum sp. Belize Diploria]MBP0031557.1 PAS domain S-box protein [Roseofilum sp. Belize BBD 4]MBP0039177.1 PAS domain S-box protein [Roseofilum sp. SID1]MBP0043309.1 PAS domain S-box protein [Roseofilum sp. SBFL]